MRAVPPVETIGHHPQLLHASVFVAPNAIVIGRVEIAAEASVWFGAVLRGDAELVRIGEGTNIQDNAVLHADPGFPCVIGANVTVGHGAVVHGCTVEDGALIGMNATVLNGAVVGAGAVIAAGAVVPEGAVIPAAALAVGIPARVVRELDADGRQAGARGAATYRRRSRLYLDYFSSLRRT